MPASSAPRAGPATGSPRLAGAFSLSVRLHAPMLVGWTVTVGVMGVVFGAISPSFDEFDSAGVRDVLERIGGAGALRDTLLGAVISVISLVVTCFAVAVVIHGGGRRAAGSHRAGAGDGDVPGAAVRVDRHRGARSAPPGCCWSPASRSPSESAVSAAPATRPCGWSPRRWPRPRPCGSWWPSRCSASRCAAGGRSSVGGSWSCSPRSDRSANWSASRDGCSTCRHTVTHRGCHSLRFELGAALALSAIAAAVLAGSWLRYRTRDIG